MAKNFTDRFGSIYLAKENTVPELQAVGPDPFWDTAEIDETRWDESFPFQLLLLKHNGGGNYTRAGNQAVFTLPIPPQALQTSMDFAIDVAASQTGIVEQHNGVVFKPIVLQGTTGVLPGRTAGPLLGSAQIVDSIFAGTIGAIRNTDARVGSFTGTHKRATITENDISNGSLKGTTGYGQFLLLQQFLESYARIKKSKAGRDYRLGFAHWKNQALYLVTPVKFDANQTVGSPMETTFTLIMKAWRRISLEQSQSSAASGFEAIARKPGAVQQMQTKINDARRILSSLRSVITAIGQDVDAVLFEPLRSTVLFAKDALGIPITAADLPVSIVRDFKAFILEAAGLGTAGDDIKAAFDRAGGAIDDEVADMMAKIIQLSVSTSKDATQSGQTPNVGTHRDALDVNNPDPANTILEDPASYFSLFDKIQVGSLNLPPAVTKKIVEERERVRLLTRLDFEKFRDGFQTLMADFCDSVGAGSASYSRIRNRQPPPVTTRTPSDDDWDVIFGLNASIMEMNRLAASGTIDDKNKLTAIEYVAGLAGRSGMNFVVPASKLQIPFPYGSTLEMVASRYLGDPDRWLEIAALNQLRTPYVDEVGFDLPLKVNGNGNTIVVGDSFNLFVGQPVWISANTVRRQKRRITNIDVIEEGDCVITLDGDPDLDSYTTQGGAYLHAYLPDTINSQKLLFIPSDKPPSEADFKGKQIPGLDQFDQWLRIGGVDLLLTQSGDAAITPDGDWKLAIGKANLVQRVRTFVGTPKGSLIRHKGYGFGVKAGTPTADISAKDMLNNLKDLLTFDTTFTGIRSASVIKTGPTLKTACQLEIAGTPLLLPVTLDVLS